MNQVTLESICNEEGNWWQAKLPDGNLWGGHSTFRELVQAIGESTYNNLQVVVTHPDPAISHVIILRGWGNPNS